MNLHRLGHLRLLILRGLSPTDAMLDGLHLPQLRWLRLASYLVRCTPDRMTQLVLSCPSLTELVLTPRDDDFTVSVADSLAARLPRERAVTLGVIPKVLEMRPGLAAGSDVADRPVDGHRGTLRLVDWTRFKHLQQYVV